MEGAEKLMGNSLCDPQITNKADDQVLGYAKGEKPKFAKYKPMMKNVDKDRYLDIRLFMLHNILCYRNMADIIQDVKRTGISSIIRDVGCL